MAGGVERISIYTFWGPSTLFSKNMLIPVFFAVQTVQEGQAETFRYLKQMGISTSMDIFCQRPLKKFMSSIEELERYNFATDLIVYVEVRLIQVI